MDYLTEKQLEELKSQLTEQRAKLTRTARQSITDQLTGDEEVPADSIDVSTGESIQVTQFRLRDREKFLLAKIDKALKLMDNEEYGYCKECDGEIGFPRLRARPVAELCIECKEEQEHKESRVHEPRPDEGQNSFFK